MPKATMTLSEIRPSRLIDWIDHLKRRRIAAKKTRATVKHRRAVTEQRLAKADAIIKEIAESGDIIGQGQIAADDRWSVPVTFVLLALEPWAFRDLCEYGAALADDEDSHDREPEVDEHTLGRTERFAQPEEESSDDGEPDLGATGILDQRRWSDGGMYDRELDPCDRGEPSLGASEVIMAGRFSPLPGVSDPEVVQCNQEGWGRGSRADDREYDAAERGEPDCDYEPDDRRLPRLLQVPAVAPEGPVVVPAVDPEGRAGAWVIQGRRASR